MSSGNLQTCAKLLDKLKQGMERIQLLTHLLKTPNPGLYRFSMAGLLANVRACFQVKLPNRKLGAAHKPEVQCSKKYNKLKLCNDSNF